MTLSELEKNGIFNYYNIIEEFSKKLEKQYIIEKKFLEMLEHIK